VATESAGSLNRGAILKVKFDDGKFNLHDQGSPERGGIESQQENPALTKIVAILSQC